MKIIAILTLGMALALVGCDQGGTDDDYNTGTGSGTSGGSITTNTAPNNNSSGTGDNATNSTGNLQQ